MGQREFLYDLEWAVEQGNIGIHSSNVEKYSKMIYQNLKNKPNIADGNFSNDSIVEMCGRYHDIGKVFIGNMYPDLLTKPSFTEHDKDTIKQHPVMGYEILYLFALKNGINTKSPLYQILSEAILYHHERLDGSGYLGLTKIPWISEIVSVADCFSAGTEKRIYSDEKDFNVVIKELKDDKYNQECVEALERGLKKENSLFVRWEH